jgi:hypothetical protein
MTGNRGATGMKCGNAIVAIAMRLEVCEQSVRSLKSEYVGNSVSEHEPARYSRQTLRTLLAEFKMIEIEGESPFRCRTASQYAGANPPRLGAKCAITRNEGFVGRFQVVIIATSRPAFIEL